METKKAPPVFDYSIIGAGLAGLQLALAFLEDDFFDDKQILLIDKSLQQKNDKTWCFWEKGQGKWEEIVSANWEKAHFFSSRKTLTFSLAPYRYKRVHSQDFYEFALRQLRPAPHFHFVRDEILSVRGKQVIGQKNTYTAVHHFDSRIPQDYFEEQ